jgi:hypothetical protein
MLQRFPGRLLEPRSRVKAIRATSLTQVLALGLSTRSMSYPTSLSARFEPGQYLDRLIWENEMCGNVRCLPAACHHVELVAHRSKVQLDSKLAVEHVLFIRKAHLPIVRWSSAFLYGPQ